MFYRPHRPFYASILSFLPSLTSFVASLTSFLPSLPYLSSLVPSFYRPFTVLIPSLIHCFHTIGSFFCFLFAFSARFVWFIIQLYIVTVSFFVSVSFFDPCICIHWFRNFPKFWPPLVPSNYLSSRLITSRPSNYPPSNYIDSGLSIDPFPRTRFFIPADPSCSLLFTLFSSPSLPIPAQIPFEKSSPPVATQRSLITLPLCWCFGGVPVFVTSNNFH